MATAGAESRTYDAGQRGSDHRRSQIDDGVDAELVARDFRQHQSLHNVSGYKYDDENDDRFSHTSSLECDKNGEGAADYRAQVGNEGRHEGYEDDEMREGCPG